MLIRFLVSRSLLCRSVVHGAVAPRVRVPPAPGLGVHHHAEPGFGVFFAVLALLIHGRDPFVAFLSYQLPRIVSGGSLLSASEQMRPCSSSHRTSRSTPSPRSCAC